MSTASPVIGLSARMDGHAVRSDPKLGQATLEEGGERKQLGSGDHTLTTPSVDAHGEHDLCSVPAHAGGRIRATRPRDQ